MQSLFLARLYSKKKKKIAKCFFYIDEIVVPIFFHFCYQFLETRKWKNDNVAKNGHYYIIVRLSYCFRKGHFGQMHIENSMMAKTSMAKSQSFGWHRQTNSCVANNSVVFNPGAFGTGTYSFKLRFRSQKAYIHSQIFSEFGSVRSEVSDLGFWKT